MLQVKGFNEKAFRKDKYKNWVLFTSTNSEGMNIFFRWTDSGKNIQQVVLFSNPIWKFPSHWFKINKRQLKIDGIKVFDVQR